MKHEFRASINPDENNEFNCILCGYPEISHGPQAVCESCGTEVICDLFPDTKHPKKMLLCAECISKEIKIAVDTAKERALKQTAENIKSAGDYFVGDIPSIKEVSDTVNADESIPANNKGYEICKIIKERIINFDRNILQLNQQARETQKQRNEFQIYLNHKMKEISEEKQKELGLSPISYKSPSAPKKAKAPSVSSKRINIDELKKIANTFGIPWEALRTIMVGRQVTAEEAAKIFIQMRNLTQETTTKEG